MVDTAWAPWPISVGVTTDACGPLTCDQAAQLAARHAGVRYVDRTGSSLVNLGSRMGWEGIGGRGGCINYRNGRTLGCYKRSTCVMKGLHHTFT